MRGCWLVYIDSLSSSMLCMLCLGVTEHQGSCNLWRGAVSWGSLLRGAAGVGGVGWCRMVVLSHVLVSLLKAVSTASKELPTTGGDTVQHKTRFCMLQGCTLCKAFGVAEIQDDFRARSMSCRSFKVVELSFCYIWPSIYNT